jgi:hypothetical protein
MKKTLRSACALGAAALMVAGCGGGSGEGLDSNGRPINEGGSGGGPLEPTFDSIQANIFTPICSVCHAGGSAPQGLRLDAANSYAMLVNTPSVEVPSLLRVKPGDPDNSYMIQKIEGHAAVGARMPFGGPYLDDATIATIRQWVTDGAPGSTSGPLTPTFASIQAHVFTPICSVCHAGGSAPQGLRLDSANSYAMLVNTPSVEVPSLFRVKPGDPDNSYMIQKIEGHAAVGARMPFGGPYLDDATIATMRQWVTEGAQP